MPKSLLMFGFMFYFLYALNITHIILPFLLSGFACNFNMDGKQVTWKKAVIIRFAKRFNRIRDFFYSFRSSACAFVNFFENVKILLRVVFYSFFCVFLFLLIFFTQKHTFFVSFDRCVLRELSLFPFFFFTYSVSK